MNWTRFSLSGPGSGHAPNLSVRGDERRIKALETVIAGVQSFNSAGRSTAVAFPPSRAHQRLSAYADRAGAARFAYGAGRRADLR